MLSTTSRRPGLPRDVRHRGDVGDAQQRVGRRLAPDDPGGRPQRRAQRVDVGEVHRRVLDPPRREDLVDEPERAAVGVVRDDEVVAGAQTAPAGGRPRAHARAERPAVPPALERGQALLQRGAGGVRAARVLVAARARAADAVLDEGGRQVQGGDHRARGGVGLLPGVDRVRGEAAHDPHGTRRAEQARGQAPRNASTSERVTTPAGLPSTSTSAASASANADIAVSSGSFAPRVGSGGDMCRSSRSDSCARPVNSASSRSRSTTEPTTSAAITGGSARTTGIWETANSRR